MMTILELLTHLVVLSIFGPKTSAFKWADFSILQRGVNIKAINRTIFYIDQSLNVSTLNHVICLSLLNPETVVDRNVKYCIESHIRVVDIPIDVHGHLVVIVSIYNLEISSSETIQSVISSSRSPDQTIRQQYFIEAIETTSSVNTEFSELSPLLMQVLKPTYGSVESNGLHLNFTADGYTAEHTVAYSFDILGVTSFVIDGPNSDIHSENVEPASWFIKMKPIFDRTYETSGYLTSTYIEFVLSDEEILRQRSFSYDWKEPSPRTTIVNKNSYVETADKDYDSNHHIHLCIWASNKLDGQKNIWLQQVKHLDPTHERFSVTWVLTSDVTNEGPHTVLNQLRLLNAKVVVTPFHDSPIMIDSLSEDPLDGTPPASALWQNDIGKLYAYMSERLRLNNYDISTLRPLWARVVFNKLVRNMKDNQCDVVVYGNDRGFNADVLLRDTAFAMRIPTAVELLNLFIDPEMLPTALIAPSHYAGQHPSIIDSIRSQAATIGVKNSALKTTQQQQQHERHTVEVIVEVIPPSVDVIKFDINRFNSHNAINHHKECVSIIEFNKKRHQSDNRSHAGVMQECIHIGFIARLAPEKNPGLFLQFAAALLSDHFPLARFTIVGDGPLRSSLEELAHRLDIAWAVHFSGWVDDSLPQVIAGMDIVVNPSLRGWSETFCIANIEVMSMGIPLVTFGVGGVGEYVDNSTLQEYHNCTVASVSTSECIDSSKKSNSEFTVTSNSVLVNTATPQAIAKAVSHLIHNKDLRNQIGQAGMKTVRSYFTVSRQMKQYRDFYTKLVSVYRNRI